jgi:hypothetical protein
MGNRLKHQRCVSKHRCHRFADRVLQQRLPGDAQGRPQEFSWWMKRARKYSSPPFISDVSTFAASFGVWWGSMRKAGGEDWGVLKTGGPNGFLVIMLLLCWWGRADASHVWKAAVDEATACLDKMSNGKRPSGTALNSPRKSTRYECSLPPPNPPPTQHNLRSRK